MTRYGFGAALGVFMHAHADALAQQLPAELQPLESHPGLGVLALTVFDFDDSEVGSYRELVVSVVVAPWAPRGQAMPHAAFFPVLLATTTEASRTHAAERWKLPELAHTLEIALDITDTRASVRVDEGERPVLGVHVGLEPPRDSLRVYQCFSADAAQLHRVNIEIAGPLAEHEDERGALELCEHPLAQRLAPLIDDRVPFREQFMGRGEQRFGSLTAHAQRRSRA